MRRFDRALSTLPFAGTLSPTAAPPLAAQNGHHHHGEGGSAALSLHNGAK